MKVYLVLTRTFFKENCVDYAMAIDLEQDLKLFSDYSNAVNEFNSIAENIRNNFSDHENEMLMPDKDLTIVFYNKYETVRYAVTLTSKEIY